jgi:hypothetical protein
LPSSGHSNSLFQKRWPFTKKDLPIVAPFLAILLSGIVSYASILFPRGQFGGVFSSRFLQSHGPCGDCGVSGIGPAAKILRWMVAAFAVTVFYGFVQYFDNRCFPPGMGGVGLDPFIWRQAFSQRVFSSFGNPNFYGNFLVIITPILLTLYFRSGGPLLRPFTMLRGSHSGAVLTDKMFINQYGGITALNQNWVAMGCFVCCLVGVLVWWKSPSVVTSGLFVFFGATFINIYATATKGAWVGFVGTLVAFSILVGLFLVGKRARRLTLHAIWPSRRLWVRRGFLWSSVFALKQRQSVDFRVFTWIGTWDMIRQQPVLGHRNRIF